MKFFATILISLAIGHGLWCATALADGGRLVLAERHDDYQISVFTSPEPLRAGSADISVLLQRRETGAPIEDAQVFVKLTPRENRSPAIVAPATKDAATNKLLYAALVEIPEPGWWNVEISGTAIKQPVQVTFVFEAGERLPCWLTVWPWFCWPIGVVLLFGVHRLLVARKHPVPLRSSRFDQIAV